MERQESILSWVKLNQNSNFGLRSLFATYIYIDHFILIIIIILFTGKNKKNDDGKIIIIIMEKQVKWNKEWIKIWVKGKMIGSFGV